jgi:hypothetical protein
MKYIQIVEGLKINSIWVTDSDLSQIPIKNGNIVFKVVHSILNQQSHSNSHKHFPQLNKFTPQRHGIGKHRTQNSNHQWHKHTHS